MKKLLFIVCILVSNLAFTCQDLATVPTREATVPQTYTFCKKSLTAVGTSLNGRVFHFAGLPFNAYWSIGDLGLLSNGTSTSYTKVRFVFSGEYAGNDPLYYIVRTDGKYLSFQIENTAFLARFSDTAVKYQKWQVAKEGSRYQIYNTLASTTPYFLRVFEYYPGKLYLSKSSCEHASYEAQGFTLVEDMALSTSPDTH